MIEAPAERVRVLISYAHGDPSEDQLVACLWTLLCEAGIDARIDLTATDRRQFWPQWMSEQIRAADFVLVIASPRYRALAEGDDVPGFGVPWEARQLQELLYRNFDEGLRTILPVILPGYRTDDIPSWLFPVAATSYKITELTAGGIAELMPVLNGGSPKRQPPPEPTTAVATRPPTSSLEIRATLNGGTLSSSVRLDGQLLCERKTPLPSDIVTIWDGLPTAAEPVRERLRSVGHRLAEAIFDDTTMRTVADRLAHAPPGTWIDVEVVGDGDALRLPVELMRFTTGDGTDLGALGLIGGVGVRRRIPAVEVAASAPLPGPVKILAAVAAPDETATKNTPLDVDAEMQAVLDAVGNVTNGQVQILEVASLEEIAHALAADRYHVLHLSAHGSPDSIELTDEDGNAVAVSTRALIDRLRDAEVRVPLIVLSSCSGAADAPAMAASLVRAGADRVVAMQTSVSDDYATVLTAALYRELVAAPGRGVAAVLARARRHVEQRRSETRRPEFGVATVLCAGADPGLVDVGAPPQPLRAAPVVPSGTSVRELSLGHLIGRRPQLRAATTALRRTETALAEHGAIAGVQLIGIGGIGKTAVAGRVMTRLRAHGWAVAVQEGRWNPNGLFAAVAAAVDADPALGSIAAELRDVAIEGAIKIERVQQLLAGMPLLLVFDDFEQNLSPGGGAFLDPVFADVLTTWCDAADTGGVLLTCRYPLPDDDRYLVRVPVPPLSPAELRRLFLRLPALRALPAQDRQLLTRVIGGHPRLIEYVDALARGKPTRLKSVNTKLRDLAQQTGVDVRRPRPLGAAIDDALLLGSADILLDELLALLTEHERVVLEQLSVSRAPMSLTDLAFTLDPEDGDGPVEALHREVEHLIDLTLLEPGSEVLMHPWTAETFGRRTDNDRVVQHEQALAMRLRRASERRWAYPDLVDIPRHLLALGRSGEIPGRAEQAVEALGSALAASAYLAEVRGLLPAGEPTWLNVAWQEVTAAQVAGDLPAAGALLTTMHQHVARRAADRPDDVWWTQWLSVVLSNLGNLAIAAGDLTTADTHYRAALTIRERLAAADPTNTGWQRDLSISHNNLGNLAVAAGDRAQAAQHFTISLGIWERLGAMDPTNAQWRNDLNYIRQRIAELAEDDDPDETRSTPT